MLKNKKKEYDGVILQKSSQLRGGCPNQESKKIIEKHDIINSKVEDLKKELNNTK